MFDKKIIPARPTDEMVEVGDRMIRNGFDAEDVFNKMIEKAPDISQAVYTVEPHGNGYAIYHGRSRHLHGSNLGHLTECTPEMAKRIEAALNMAAAQK